MLVRPLSTPDNDWSDSVHCMSGSTERKFTTETEQVRSREDPASTGRGLLGDISTTGTGRSAEREGNKDQDIDQEIILILCILHDIA